MKTHLDYAVVIPHHSEDTEAALDVIVTNYSSGPLMTITTEKNRISLNRTELESLLAILDRYDDAQKIMEGKAP